MMGVASAQRRDAATAIDHLRRAIALNGENRSRARQDPDLDVLRDDPSFRSMLDAPPPETPAAKPAPAMANARARKPRR
jgi:hypothetical protein